jgi:hypothetical protein
MNTHIAFIPLVCRIQQGRVNKERTAFVGTTKDVTNDVLHAVIEKAEFHGGAFECIEADGRRWVITVVEELNKESGNES